MREIRLCDDCSFDETLGLCNRKNIGIEVQTFHDLTKRESESELDFETRIKNEVLREKELLKNFNGGISMHAPFWEMNVGSKVPEIVAIAKKYYDNAYRIAKELGCTEMVVHNGYYPGTSYEPKWIERAIKFWQIFLADKDDSITICIENQFELNSEMMKQIIDGVGDSRLKICLDIGHAHANSAMTPIDWVKSLGDRIAYYHLHNNHGKNNDKVENKDEHLGLNHGTINIGELFKAMEEYTPHAIWNLESQPKYFVEDLDTINELGYSLNNKTL